MLCGSNFWLSDNYGFLFAWCTKQGLFYTEHILSSHSKTATQKAFMQTTVYYILKYMDTLQPLQEIIYTQNFLVVCSSQINTWNSNKKNLKKKIDPAKWQVYIKQ